MYSNILWCTLDPGKLEPPTFLMNVLYPYYSSVMTDSCDGDGSWKWPSREARMAEVARLLGEPLEEEAPEGRPRSRAGGLAALPYLRLRHPLSVLGINYQQFLRHYLENYPIAPGRIQELEERRRRFVEACRAREAAFDIEYLRNPQRVDFDILTFTIALTASEVINPLIEELGCDKFISRE